MRASAVLAFVIVVLISSLVIGGLWTKDRLAERDRMVDYLLADVEKLRGDLAAMGEENAQLGADNLALSEEIETLKSETAAAKQEVENALVPQEIGGAADFPIQRGMAKGGESVATFAKREGTSVEVLKALNPWLDPNQTFKKYQTLWLPVK